MLPFDTALAQMIVDRAMAIIACNVNVMDAHGIIVASGERDRVGAVHQGALLVLARQAAVEINASDADALAGAKPGVNLPLRGDGAIVGCIGLSGAPDAVRPYAELVRLAAETMLEQARLMQAVARDARLHEEIVLALVRGDAPAPVLATWARRLGVDLTVPRLAAIIEVAGDPIEAEVVLGDVQRLHALLADPGDGYLVATGAANEIIVLIPALDARGMWDLAAQRRRVAALHARLATRSALRLAIALGPYIPGAGGLARSYRDARATLAVGRRRAPDQPIHVHADLRLPVALEALRRDGHGDDLAEPLRRLAAHDRHGHLRRTLAAWFAADMRAARAAEALGIHRNTLDDRLRRIGILCDLDPTTTEGCVRLYLALELTAGA